MHYPITHTQTHNTLTASYTQHPHCIIHTYHCTPIYAPTHTDTHTQDVSISFVVALGLFVGATPTAKYATDLSIPRIVPNTNISTISNIAAPAGATAVSHC